MRPKLRTKRMAFVSCQPNAGFILRWSLITVLKFVFIAATVCNCSHPPYNSSTLSLRPSLSVLVDSSLTSLSDVSSLSRSTMVNNNTNSFGILQSRQPPNFQPNSNATMSLFRNFSTHKKRMTRQTLVSKTVEFNQLCQADQDCQQFTTVTPTQSGNQKTHALDAQNDTVKNVLAFICINGVCLPNDNLDNKNDSLSFPPSTSDASSERLRMLPIMIVLGVMFVGICVAMNLFSRARFKNQRSGIFTNPRVLKVANAQSGQSGGKRRKSKVSSRRSRTELLARAQQMSEQLQKQQQLQMEQDNHLELEQEDDDEKGNVASLSRNAVKNQMTTYVQIESSLPANRIDTIAEIIASK